MYVICFNFFSNENFIYKIKQNINKLLLKVNQKEKISINVLIIYSKYKKFACNSLIVRDIIFYVDFGKKCYEL